MVSGERYKVIMDHLVAFATAYDIELFSNPFDSQCGTLQFPVAVCGPHVHRRWWEIVVVKFKEDFEVVHKSHK